MDRLTSMAVFVACVERGSLAAAARQCGISHAMATKHLRALEESLGVRLLDITTRRLSPTEAGRRYLARSRQILDDMEEAAIEASAFQSEPRGLLRLTAPATFGRLHLASVIAEFLERHPHVSIDAEFTDRFVRLVDEGFDVAVRIRLLPDSTLIARRLGPCRMITCAAPGYLAKTRPPAHPAELRSHPCLCLNTITHPGVWHFRSADEDIQVNVAGRLRADSLDLLCAAASRGLGIVHGPSFALGPLIASGRLRRILQTYPGPPLDISAVLPSNRHLSMKVRAFVDFLVERIGDEPPWDRAAFA